MLHVALPMPDPFHGDIKIPRDKGVPHGVYRADGPPPSKRCNLQTYIEKGYDKKFFEEHTELAHIHDPKKIIDVAKAEAEEQKRQQEEEERKRQEEEAAALDELKQLEEQKVLEEQKDHEGEGDQPAPEENNEVQPEEPEEAPVFSPPDEPEDPTYGGHTPEELDRIREAFDRFDGDNSGAIDQSEIRECLGGVDVWLSDDQVDSLINAVDTNNSGQIEFGEFVKLYDLALKKANEPDEPDVLDEGEDNADNFSGFTPRDATAPGDNVSDEDNLGQAEDRDIENGPGNDEPGFPEEPGFPDDDDASYRAEVNLEEIPDYEGLSYQDEGTIFTDTQD